MTDLRELARDLNSETERLNELLRRAQQQLKDMNFGVRAEVEFTENRRLVFEKDGPDWLLFVYRGEIRTPLLQASRKDRTDAGCCVKRLCEQMKKNAVELASTLAIATEQLDEFLYSADVATPCKSTGEK